MKTMEEGRDLPRDFSMGSLDSVGIGGWGFLFETLDKLLVSSVAAADIVDGPTLAGTWSALSMERS